MALFRVNNTPESVTSYSFVNDMSKRKPISQ